MCDGAWQLRSDAVHPAGVPHMARFGAPRMARSGAPRVARAPASALGHDAVSRSSVRAVGWERSRRFSHRYIDRRLMPNRRAAAALLPRASRSACSTCARCAFVRKAGSHVEALAAGADSVNTGGVGVSIAGGIAASTSRSLSIFPSLSKHARSITLRSSRTLPGHGACSSVRSAAAVMPMSGRLSRSVTSRRNTAERYGMSSRRSRSGTR